MRKKMTVALFLVPSAFSVAEESIELEEIQVETQRTETNLLGERPNISDQIIDKRILKQKSATLGDALGGELGIRSNQYGGGASAPIIRGQEGKRIKVLQNSNDIVDMSNMSPDHVITVDTILAKQVEIVRGPTTLLYSSGNAAGVINVVDHKIPTSIPKDGIDGEIGFRFNTNNKEKLTNVALTLGAGSNFALHVEGLDRQAGNYKTPQYTHYEFSNENALKAHLAAPDNLRSLEREYQHWLANKHHHPYRPHRPKPEQHYIRKEQDYQVQKAKFENAIVSPQHLDYLPDSWAKSRSGSIGLSWIGDKGFIGFAYTQRKDRYGLPAHNPMYEGCGAYVILPAVERKKSYLLSYPQLMDEADINYLNPRADCLSKHAFDSSHNHSHQRTNNSNHGTPYIDMLSKRYDLRAELNQPFRGIEKIRGQFSYVDYLHHEKEGQEIQSTFKNRGITARVEFSHAPIGNLTGIWGVQYFSSKNSAYSPYANKGRQVLNDNATKNISLFGLEQYQWGNITFELSGRVEQQTVAMDYDLSKITASLSPLPNPRKSSYVAKTNQERAEYLVKALAATKAYKDRAYSYALGIHWAFSDKAQLSLTASHQERLPNAQELYTHGTHLATNSFEVGNRLLSKEKSNNIELSLAYQGEKLDYKISAYSYYFDNYIYLQTLNESLGNSPVIAPYSLRINRYTQAKARFYGFEGQIGYQLTPIYHVAIFGDYIKGRLKDLPDAVVAYDHREDKRTYAPQEDQYSPRLPPARFGARVKAEFNPNISAELEYYRIFKQNKTAKFEMETPKHDMVNLSLTYRKQWQNHEMEIFFKGSNLLNEQVYAHETFLPYIPQMGRNFTIGINYKF